jgi:hypothetical protein
LAGVEALVQGIKSIYGFDIADMPTSVMMKDLDTFAMWSFRAIRSLSHVSEQETDTEVVIPLVQPVVSQWRASYCSYSLQQSIATAPGGQPITLPFDFPDNGLLASGARLKSIGLSFGAE